MGDELAILARSGKYFQDSKTGASNVSHGLASRLSLFLLDKKSGLYPSSAPPRSAVILVPILILINPVFVVLPITP
jgi:hypothetical protein